MKNGTKRLFTTIRARNWMRLVGPTIGVCLLAAFLATSVGASTTPTTYYACVNMKTGAIYIVNAGDTCKNGYTPMSWNQVGPQGPQGPAGPQGPQGPAGPTQILEVQEVISAETLISLGQGGAAVAQCPAGTFVTGGGFSFFVGIGQGEIVVSSVNGDRSGWFVEALISDTSTGPASLRADALCASLA